MRLSKMKKLTFGGLIIASVLISLHAFSGSNPAERTLSNLGLYYPRFFITWGLLASLSVFFNLGYLARKLNVKSKIFNVVRYVGSFAVLITVTINNPNYQWMVITHWASGMTFGALSFFSTLYLFWRKFKTARGLCPYLTLCALAAAFTVITIIFLGLTALAQIVILIVCQLCLFTANFVERKAWLTLGSNSHQIDEPQIPL